MRIITIIFLVFASLNNYSQAQSATNQMQKLSASDNDTIEIQRIELYYINRNRESSIALSNDDLKDVSFASHRII